MDEIQTNSSRLAGKRADWARKTTPMTLEKSLMAVALRRSSIDFFRVYGF